jgi:hypothetical protein
MIPTPKTIARRLFVSMETARAVRREMERYENGAEPFATETLERIGEILSAAGWQNYGTESIPPGDGKRSPSIEYVNTGDTYYSTILHLDGFNSGGQPTGCGRWAVGAWGDIVERGAYA